MQTVKPATKLELPLRFWFVWYRRTQTERSQTEVLPTDVHHDQMNIR